MSCSPSTSAAPSSRRASSTPRATILHQGHHAPTAGRTPRRCSRRVSTLLDESRSVAERHGHRVRCGVGCGGPMAPGGEAVSPLNIPAVARLPAPAPPRRAHRPRRPSSTTTPRRSPLGEGWLGAAAGRARLHRDGRVHGRRRRHRARRPPARRRDAATPATSATSSWSRTGGRARVGARGCLEAEASGPAIEARTGRPRRRRRRACVERSGRLVGRARGVGVQPARPSARRRRRFGGARLRRRRSSPPPRPSSTTGRADRVLARARGSCPAGLGDDGPLVGAAARRPARDDPAVACGRMHPTYSAEAEAYREKVQAFLAEHLPPDWQRHRALARGRGARARSPASGGTRSTRTALLALAWPKEYGGAGLTSLEQVIVAEEFAKAGVPAGGDQRRVRHPDARQHAHAVGHRRAEGALPARGS